jgi:hypothetical protein
VVHIRRFGPAILFATEGFESFNAVIRAKSIHSNRQAPSRDIAQGFAQGSRIRHILSGGYIVQHPPEHAKEPQSSTPNLLLSITESINRLSSKPGPGPTSLIAQPNIITD